MNCIIVDDEPMARRAMELLIEENGQLDLIGTFNSAMSASAFMAANTDELEYLDIQMPKINGLEFARTINDRTLIIFTTAFTEYAIESYDIDAIDYLVKPVELPRFQKAVSKAISYHKLLMSEKKDNIETIDEDFLFVKSERRYFKVEYKDILFIEGLKDYSIIQCTGQRIITRMNLKTIFQELPASDFMRVSKSYIINTQHVHSFDNNSVYVQDHEILIGCAYRDVFMDYFLKKKRNR